MWHAALSLGQNAVLELKPLGSELYKNSVFSNAIINPPRSPIWSCHCVTPDYTVWYVLFAQRERVSTGAQHLHVSPLLIRMGHLNCKMTSFTTTTRIHQGFPFLCKLRIRHLNLAEMKFKHEKKNEKDSGRSSKWRHRASSLFPIERFHSRE